MTQLALTRNVHHYHEEKRRPDARLFAVGELVRFPQRENEFAAGTVLRVAGVDRSNQVVQLRRKSGETVEWKPSASAQIFSRSDGEVRAGTILEWSTDQPEHGIGKGDLARVVSVHPKHGVTIASHKLGELRFELEPGVWHYAITPDGAVGHLREAGAHRLESYRDFDPAPEAPTHEASFDHLARPFSLATHGAPPGLDTISRGDLVYVASTKAKIPDNHVFVVGEIDLQRGRVHLIEGRELSAQPERTSDVWWTPKPSDEVRLYQPATAIAAQDLVVWKRDDPKLLVRRGDYAEVLEVEPRGIALSGVTSTPELIRLDRERWPPSFHRENETWHLSRSDGRSRAQEQNQRIAEFVFTPT